MTGGDEQDAVMVRYLLGQSPEEERAQVEERYFSDGEYFDQLLALEDSLIDDFVSGRMPAEQLRAFKEEFLSSRQGEVRFTRALFEAVTKKKPNQPTPKQTFTLPVKQQRMFARTRSSVLAASIAALIFLTVGIALFLRSHTLQNRLAETEAELVRLREGNDAAQRELSEAISQNESSARELETERNKRIEAESLLLKQGRSEPLDPSSDFMTVVLGSAFIPRGSNGTTREVRVSESFRWLRLVVSLEGSRMYDSYRISMKRAGERELVESASVKPSGSSNKLAITMPATNLRQGDYIVTLYGERSAAPRTELAQYSLRITD